MQIAVVANCQARPIASLVRLLAPVVRDVSTIVVHLADEQGEEKDYAVLEKADFILAQFVTDQYFARHLATSRIKSRFGSKVVSWPNIFFRGQTPDLAYASVRRSDGSTKIQRLAGPLREYHHKSIFAAWRAGHSPKSCMAMLNSRDAEYSEQIVRIAENSIQDLRNREISIDMSISDIVEQEWRNRRLFFTFNHPTAYLLQIMASRLLSQIGAKIEPIQRPLTEPLNLIIPPVFERDALVLGQALSGTDVCRGAEIVYEGAQLSSGAPCQYDLVDLVEHSFRAYEATISPDDEVRFSPP